MNKKVMSIDEIISELDEIPSLFSDNTNYCDWHIKAAAIDETIKILKKLSKNVNLSEDEKLYLKDLLNNKINSYGLQIKMEKFKKSKVAADKYSDMFIDEIDKDISKILSNQRYANSILKKIKKEEK